MKAVIWTDVWQIMWMVAGFVAILAVTCIDFGGFMEVVNLNIVSTLGYIQVVLIQVVFIRVVFENEFSF